MVKLIIFDMDGVLVDACEWHRIALNQALKSICNYEISIEDHYKEYNGLPTKKKLLKLAEKNVIQKEKINQIEFEKQKITMNIIEDYASVRQEKIDMMQFLKNKNVTLACYTNSIRMTAELMLRKTGILDYLNLLITNQDVNYPKPDPEGYIFCMQKFAIKNNECIIVEDSDNGVKAAMASGAHVIKVNNPDEVTKDLFTI